MLLTFRHAFALLLALLFVAARPAAADSRAAEYMIYQYPGVSLVVNVDTREAEFTAKVTGPEGALLTEAGVEGRRIGPVWLYVDSTDRPRQLMVHVQPRRAVDRADIGMELIQLSTDDANARRQAQAYRLLAHGMQRVYADDTSTWAQRGQSLRNAARAFSALGMERMALWADFYAAHLVLHRLDDVATTLEMTAGIDRAVRRAGFEEIALVNEVLSAEALLRGAEKAAAPQAADYYRRAHAALQSLADRAGRLGYPGEQGLSLYRDGAAWERQGDLERAIQRYEQALAIAASTSDTELLNRIRATTAAAYEARGSTSGAIGLLEAIAGDLPQTAAADMERAKTLFEQGRLLNQAYRYTEAVPILEQALRLQQNNPAVSQWGRTGLELGRARYELGDLQEARGVLLESLPRAADTEPAERARAYGALAHMARFERRFDDMRRYRERQGALPEARPAVQAFESACDVVASQGDGSAAAVRLFARARDLAAASGETTVRDRAELHHCLHTLHAGAACDDRRAAAAPGADRQGRRVERRNAVRSGSAPALGVAVRGSRRTGDGQRPCRRGAGRGGRSRAPRTCAATRRFRQR
ncbi:MAG: tetratricopeptide repeat protein [Xanthomonadales bacterium]